MGGPIEVYGPIERTCRDCKQELVFSAAEQKHWYETLGFFIDATAVRCPACRKIEQKKRSYGEAVIAAKSAPSSAAHLNVARAALAWREVGGHFSLDKARAHCHLAKKLGAKTEAEQLLQALSRRTK
ncbi:MAG: zinc-ribbon domain containing protein [Polyangiaceae bacterium]